MNNILCIVLVFAALLLTASAQERTIDKTEFDTIQRNSFRGLGGKPHRVINTNEFFSESRPDEKNLIKSITEFLPGRYHSIFESKTIKKEKIKIGDKTYTRDGDGDWREGAAPEPIKPPTENKLVVAESEIEYKFLGTERINNQNVNVYGKTERRKTINPTNNRETSSVATTKYWFGDASWFWKSETVTEFLNEKSKNIGRSTTVYEIDPNIKIEAPF